MNALSAVTRHRERKHLLAALLVPLLMIGHAAQAQFDNGPLQMGAFAVEELEPGRTIGEGNPIFDDGNTSLFAMPGDRVEFLYHASQGENLSGRSTNIQSAFASASADQTLNGGVGVTSFIGGNPSNQDPTALQHLTAQAEWARHFSFTGATSEVAFMEVVVPALEVGLIGVPSEATSISNTETAEADAKFDLTIEHNDGTENVGTIFEFGLRVFEKQVVSGPQLFNVVDRTLLGINDETQHLFKLHDNGVPSNPRFFLDPVDYQFALPVLQPGDEVFFDYSLTAEGTTNGGEQGFVAFLGDPFSLDAKPDNLVISLAPTTAVPEPATWVLTILGFGAVARFATRRRILARPEISPAPAK